MYSPKIDEELIPIIYTKAKQSKIPMTRYINAILRESLTEKVADGSPTEPTQTTTKKILTQLSK